MIDKVPFDIAGKKVFVAGHNGLAGSAIVRRLESERCTVVTVGRDVVDLRRQDKTEEWFARNRPEVVFHAAGKVGGIFANSHFPADFIADNLAIALNVMRAAVTYKTEKLMFLGSSCIYPRNAPQPMSEDLLLTGALEPTNEWYAVAKISGMKLAEAYRRQFGVDFISVMPTNLYGPNDNYDPDTSHVPAALIRRFHEAKVSGKEEVVVWGTGAPRREFLASDDLADACVFIMKNYSDPSFINAGTGQDVTIREFAEILAEVVGFQGRLTFDTTRPDGAPRKLLDVSKLAKLGWKAKTELRTGLALAYNDFLVKGTR